MDEALNQTVNDMMARERFGVLATAARGRIHTSTILFAAGPERELVFAIRPATLKAHLASVSPRVAFQVDNRDDVPRDRNSFTRLSFEGTLHRIPRHNALWQHYHDIYAAKHPFGGILFASPEIELYVLTPALLRVAVGGRMPEEITVFTATQPEADTPDHATEPAPMPPAPVSAPVVTTEDQAAGVSSPDIPHDRLSLG